MLTYNAHPLGGLAYLLGNVMSEDTIIPVLAVSLVFGIPLIAIVGHYSYCAWKAWLELNLKREMVARGYTTEEILAVLQATTGESESPGTDVSQQHDPARL